MIAFILKVSLCWLFFYGVYELFLKRKTFFNANRSYLLITMIVGIVLPLLEFIPWKNESNVAHVIYPMLMEIDDLQAVVASPVEDKFNWFNILYIIYGIGFALSLIRFSLGIQKIIKLFSSSTKINHTGYVMVLTNEDHLPFSFFRWVFFSKTMTLSNEIDSILTHEIEHIKGRHSFDVLATELLKVIFWCSPMIYLYRNALKEVHEFLADQVVVKDSDKMSYKKLLLEQTNNGLQMALTHQFFNSHLKNRLKMISQKRSGRPTLVMYALGIPVLLLLLFAFTYALNPEPVEVMEEGYSNSFDPFDFIAYADETDQSKMPYIQINGEDIEYPLSDHIDVNGKVGSVCTYVAKYAFDTYGEKAKLGYINLQDPTFKKDFWNETMAKKVYSMLQAKKDTVPSTGGNTISTNAEIFKVVQEMPRFPGCENITGNNQAKSDCAKQKMLEYIYTNLKYPDEAREAGVEGMAVAQFIVDSEGGINNVKIIRSIGSGTDAEVLSVLNRMNNLGMKWTPGYQSGVAVNVLYTIPIKFKLEDKEDDEEVEVIGYAKTSENIEEVFKVVDQMPRFPGCENLEGDKNEKNNCAKQKLLEYVYTSIKYPKGAREKGIEGMVVVRFVVTKDGKIVQVELVRNPGGGTGSEGVRIVQEMNDLKQRWTPGYLRGEAVNVQYTLPIRFKLEGDEKKDSDAEKVCYVIDGKVENLEVFEKLSSDAIATINVSKGDVIMLDNGISLENYDKVVDITTKKAIAKESVEKLLNIEGGQKKGIVLRKSDGSNADPLIVVDGEITKIDIEREINPDDIASINVLKGEAAERKYGDKGIDGVVEITTKNAGKDSSAPVKDFDTPAYFVGCHGIADKAAKKSCSEQNLLNFIYKNLNYPKEARKKEIEGMVVARFILGKDGKISDIKIVRSVDGLSAAAKGVVAKMADEIVWEPAMKDGKPVAMQWTLPIKFKLQDKVEKVESESTTSDNMNTEIREDELLKLELVKVYPNPTKDVVNISFNAKKGPIKINLLNVEGKLVRDLSSSDFDGTFNESISLKDLAAGVVFLRVEQEGKVFFEKIVVE